MAESVFEQAHKIYPRLKDYDFQFIDSSKDGMSDGRQMETYPADERDNPMPGKPTIQLFNPKATPQDIMGEYLHILKSSDPNVKSTRQAFMESMTPQQQEKLVDQYKYDMQNFGEQRPFEQWKESSGVDAWFRGYMTGQWPESAYTPGQVNMFKSLDQYLKKK